MRTEKDFPTQEEINGYIREQKKNLSPNESVKRVPITAREAKKYFRNIRNKYPNISLEEWSESLHISLETLRAWDENASRAKI